MSVIDPQTWRDADDGRALRELREECEQAQPYRAWIVAEWAFARISDQQWEVRVEKHVGDGVTRWRGATLAEAADAARMYLLVRS